MATAQTFGMTVEQPGLIVFRHGAAVSAWDPDLSALIERLEDELGVFVTGADPGRRAPSLRDAAAAARFAGCSSVVVVVSDCRTASTDIRDLTAATGVRAVIVSTPTWGVDDVARSYRSALRSGALAA